MFELIINSTLAAQSCLPLCEPMDCSPPGSSVQRIPQAKILRWVIMPSFRGAPPPKDQTHVSLHLLRWQVGS